MLLLWVALLGAAPSPLPSECESPATRDVSALQIFAQKSGALSVGLDSVATWCFGSGGEWTAGAKGKPPSAPVGDCARALASCESAKKAVTPELKALLVDALADLERPYLNKKYVPKRTGLSDRPSDVVDCAGHSRPELFAQAQARMDLARLSSQAFSEYANYKTWLFSEGLKCSQAAHAGQVDATQRAMAVDAPAPAAVPNPDKSRTVVVQTPVRDASNVLITPVPAGGAVPSASTDKGRPAAPGAVAAASSARETGVATDGKPPAPGAVTAASPAGEAPAGRPVALGAARDTGGAANGKTPSPGAVTTPGGDVGAAAAANTDKGRTTASAAGESKTPSTAAVVSPTREPGAVADKSRTVLVQTPAPDLNVPPRDAAGVTVALVEPAKPVLPVGGPSTERERILSLPPADRWAALGQARGRLELDRDYTLGFLASRELRDCRCQRPNPTGLAQRYARNDNLPQLEADEVKNEQCEFCLQDAFASWKVRVQKQCAMVDTLSEFEVGVLQRSDDGNGLPPRCFETALSRRDAGAALRAAVTGAAPDAGAKPSALARAEAPAAVSKPVASAPPTAVTQTPLADTFSRAQDWAPIPLREDGRLYVRLFMSSACAADVLPGPIQARTGDLLVIPYNARQLSVRSPCGGLAEVYWGREAKPRVSEIFARNQPLHLQFQPQ